MLWKVNDDHASDCLESLAEEFGISQILSKLLAIRGIKNKEEAESFLKPSLKSLSDPFEVSYLKEGVEYLSQAIDQKASIFIFGDYDVDGISSIVQMVSILREYGLDPSYCVPYRLSEGYGLTREAIDRGLKNSRPDLMIVVDCGTNSKESIDYLKSLGIFVLIIDHHQLTTELSKNALLINPHVNDVGQENKGWFNLSAAGLVFKFLHGLIKYRRGFDDPIANDIKLSQIIDLAGLGTIADLVPLQGENRILAKYALHHLRNNKRKGLLALLKESRVSNLATLSSSDVSFRLAPRINASGRLSDGALPVELLLTDEAEFARKSAKQLGDLNNERQMIQKKMVEAAELQISDFETDQLAYILHDKEWHPGVVGIVASRISRKLNRPCLILGNEGDMIKGSGRSVGGVDLVKVLTECEPHLENWGGHPMAVGVKLSEQNLEAFSKAFNQAMARFYPDGIPEPELDIACWIDFEDLGDELMEELSLLEPYGQMNPEPILGLKGVMLKEEARTFAKIHKQFTLMQKHQPEKTIKGIAWNFESMPEANEPVDIVLRLEWDTWNNVKTSRVILVDWKKSIL